jgi:hypothetical protein
MTFILGGTSTDVGPFRPTFDCCAPILIDRDGVDINLSLNLSIIPNLPLSSFRFFFFFLQPFLIDLVNYFPVLFYLNLFLPARFFRDYFLYVLYSFFYICIFDLTF